MMPVPPGFWRPSSAGGGGPPSLNDPPPFAAGTRKLVSGYGDSCLRVRRSSDNTEQDIGFSGNDLDTTSLLSFVGANSGYIVRLYNQGTLGHGTSNGYDLVQTSSASQPRIVNAGSLETINGEPAINILANTWIEQAGTIAWLAISDDHSVAILSEGAYFGYGRQTSAVWLWELFPGSATGGPWVTLDGSGAASYQLSGTPSDALKGRVYRIEQNYGVSASHSYRENDSAFSSASIPGNWSLRVTTGVCLMAGRGNDFLKGTDELFAEMYAWDLSVSAADETTLTGQWTTLYGI